MAKTPPRSMQTSVQAATRCQWCLGARPSVNGSSVVVSLGRSTRPFGVDGRTSRAVSGGRGLVVGREARTSAESRTCVRPGVCVGCRTSRALWGAGAPGAFAEREVSDDARPPGAAFAVLWFGTPGLRPVLPCTLPPAASAPGSVGSLGNRSLPRAPDGGGDPGLCSADGPRSPSTGNMAHVSGTLPHRFGPRRADSSRSQAPDRPNRAASLAHTEIPAYTPTPGQFRGDRASSSSRRDPLEDAGWRREPGGLELVRTAIRPAADRDEPTQGRGRVHHELRPAQRPALAAVEALEDELVVGGDVREPFEAGPAGRRERVDPGADHLVVEVGQALPHLVVGRTSGPRPASSKVGVGAAHSTPGDGQRLHRGPRRR